MHFVKANQTLSAVALAVALVVCGPVTVARADHIAEVDNLTIVGERDEKLRILVDPTKANVTQPTVAELMKRAPGGNMNFNGALTGIGQYRGMFGFRLNTQVDGVPAFSAGPNWMDAPLQNAPMPLIDTFEVQRGITPVSVGSESIGGHVHARRLTSDFSAGDDFEFHGAANASAQSVDSGYGVGVLLSGSNARHRVHGSLIQEKGDDTEFANGEIHPTEYERTAYGIGYGFQTADHEFGIDYTRNEADDSGTPALPMDIRYIDTDQYTGIYRGDVGSMHIGAKLYYTDVEHLMDNFGLRAPPPDPARFRQNLATGDATGFDLNALMDIGNGELNVGINGDLTNHNSLITNPNNAMFFVDNFNDVKRDRVGLYGEWNTPISDTWSYQLGARYNRMEADAGEVDGTPAQMLMGPRILRDRFNAADRNKTFNDVDLVGKLFYRVSEEVRVDIGIGRKTRAPIYQELFLWLPLQATAGLGDGKNYVGNLELDSETAYVIDAGLDFRSGGSYFGPRVFFKRVDDYIQGTPSTDPVVIMVSTANGDPNPLQFNNVDAELVGIDADFGMQLTEHVRMDGVISYVRGTRRDIDDNLYRIAPLNAILGFTYDRANWAMTLEGMAAADQNKVSVTNEERETDGYGLLNLWGSYQFMEGLSLKAGINNLFDKHYADHTNGTNRVRNSDVAPGERLPGPGRSFFARLSLSW